MKQKLHFVQYAIGGVPSAFDCFLGKSDTQTRFLDLENLNLNDDSSSFILS